MRKGLCTFDGRGNSWSAASVVLVRGLLTMVLDVVWERAWRDQNTDAWGKQVLISTTNNTVVPFQAFGITSQTMGCKNGGKFWVEYKTNMFAQLNFENLSQEMAQGQGEHLASLATLMGVPADHQAEFFAMTQEKYTTLVKAGEVSPVAMIKALNDAVATHPVLAKVSAQ